MSKKIQFDPESIRHLANILVETGLTEIEFEGDGCRIYVAKEHPPVVSQNIVSAPSPSPTPFMATVNDQESRCDYLKHPGLIKSPMVGTAYLSSEPGSAHFVKEGDLVQVGQTLLIVEAMKVMNQIKATQAGRVLKLLVQNSNPVEFDEPLLIIE